MKTIPHLFIVDGDISTLILIGDYDIEVKSNNTPAVSKMMILVL